MTSIVPDPESPAGTPRREIPVPVLALRLSAEVLDLLYDSGMTQSTLAARCGVSQKHVSEVLNGRAPASVAMWDRFIREATP